jgi:hypothetical protein
MKEFPLEHYKRYKLFTHINYPINFNFIFWVRDLERPSTVGHFGRLSTTSPHSWHTSVGVSFWSTVVKTLQSLTVLCREAKGADWNTGPETLFMSFHTSKGRVKLRHPVLSSLYKQYLLLMLLMTTPCDVVVEERGFSVIIIQRTTV